MKKNYSKPAIEIIELGMEGAVLVGSPSVDLGGTTTDPAGVPSSRSIWNGIED